MDIKICKKIVHKSITEIKPYWRNPRKNDKTVEALKNIIPKVGFNVPLYIDNEGVIIKGHARYRAAVQLGMTEIPCIISDNSEEQNRLDRIADNKISELAEWDLSTLQSEIDSISDMDFDFSSIGIEVDSGDIEPQFSDDAFAGFGHNVESAMKEPIPQTVMPERKIDFVNAKCPKCGNPMTIRLEL